MRKRIHWYIRIFLGIFMLYMGVSVYFMEHFFWGTSVNGENTEFMTTRQAETVLLQQIQEYQLTLTGRQGQEEQVDIGELGILKLSLEDVIRAKRRQNGFLWPRMFWQRDSYRISPRIEEDSTGLDERIEELRCVKEGQEPKNAWVELTEEGYIVHEEQQGTKIQKETLKEQILKASSGLEPVLSLEESGCYESVTVTIQSEEIVSLTEKLEHWLGAEITYVFGPESEIVDRTAVRNFISLEGYEASLNPEAVKAWIQELADRRDTYKRPRSFKSTLRGTITVKNSSVGWQIDQEKESAALLSYVEEGAQVRTEPAYLHTGNAWSHNYDIGDTYIEVDLKAQKMWFYKDGQCLVETDVVTGDAGRGSVTPEMVAAVRYKQRNAVLRGGTYAAPVTYWMPFYGNYGIHDANWRRKFGGEIYKTNGSHGCVNTPTAAMKIIFENSEKGTPIILYN